MFEFLIVALFMGVTVAALVVETVNTPTDTLRRAWTAYISTLVEMVAVGIVAALVLGMAVTGAGALAWFGLAVCIVFEVICFLSLFGYMDRIEQFGDNPLL